MLKATQLSGFGAGQTETLPNFISSSAITVNATSTVTVTAPANIQDGDLLVLYTFNRGTTGQISSLPTGFKLVFHEANTTNSQGIFTKVASSESGNYSITWSSSTGIGGAAILVYRGATAINVVGDVTRATGTNTATAAAVTPTESGILVGAFFFESGSASINTPPSGMTQRATNGSGATTIALYDAQIVAGVSSGSNTCVFSSSNETSGQFFVVTNSTATTIQYINYAATQNGATGSSLVINKPTNTQDNDLMIAFLCSTRTTPDTWTDAGGWTEVADSGGNSIRVAYKVAASEGSNYTFTCSSASGTLSGVIVTFRGASYVGVSAITAGANYPLTADISSTDPKSLGVGFCGRAASGVTATSYGQTQIALDSDATSPSWGLFYWGVAKGHSGNSMIDMASTAYGVAVVIKPS